MAETVELPDHLEFGAGSTPPARTTNGRYPVYGANGLVGYAAEHNARGPLIVIGPAGSFCGSLRYCEGDAWVTDNALTCRAKNPNETRYWYYALESSGLNRRRAGSGQPLLNQSILRSVSIRVVTPHERQPTGEVLAAFDDKITANNRVIAAAEALMTVCRWRRSRSAQRFQVWRSGPQRLSTPNVSKAWSPTTAFRHSMTVGGRSMPTRKQSIAPNSC